MSAAHINPPLPFTKQAIVGHLQHHATNGPAYVQIQATKALAHIIGLYKQAKDVLHDAVETITETATSPFKGLKFEGYGGYDKGQDDEDEEAARKEDDDVP